MITNKSEILYLNENLIENKKLKFRNYDRLFFNNNNVYIIIKINYIKLHLRILMNFLF